MAESAPAQARSRWWRTGLQVLITAGLVTVLVTCFDLRALAARVAQARPLPLVAATLCSVLSLGITAQRWRLIVRQDGANPPLGALYMCYLESMFFGLFLPSAVGGDVYRGWYLYGQVGGVRRAAVNLLTERFVGVWGLCLLGLGGMASGGVRGTHLFPGFLILYLAVIALSALLMNRRAQRAVNAGLRRVRLTRLADTQDLVSRQVRGYAEAPGLLLRLLALTVIQQVFGGISAYFVGLSAGLHLGLAFYLVAMPVTWLAAMIPALGGLGPREGTLAYLAAAVGADGAGAVAAGGLLLAVRIALGAIGGLVVLVRKLWRRGCPVGGTG